MKTLRRRPTYLSNTSLPPLEYQPGSYTGEYDQPSYHLKELTNHVIDLDRYTPNYRSEIKKWRRMNSKEIAVQKPVILSYNNGGYYSEVENQDDIESYVIPSISTIQMRRPRKKWGYLDPPTPRHDDKRSRRLLGENRFRLSNCPVDKTEVEHYRELERGYRKQYVRFWGPPTQTME